MRNREPFQFVDLFAGAGGLSWGFMKARGENGGRLFEPLLLVDQDEQARLTFLKNSGNFKNYFCTDIDRLTAKEIRRAAGLKGNKRLDMLIGGPPCQGFSRLNKSARDALDDPRNKLLKKFLRLAIELKPRVVLFENVPSFVTFGDGQFIEETKKLLGKAGYVLLAARTLNAAEYGVPQLRRRAFVVAIHKSTQLKSRSLSELELFPPPKVPIQGNGEELQEDNMLYSLHVPVEAAIGDLPSLEAGDEMIAYEQEPFSDYQIEMRNGSTFLANHKARSHTREFVEEKIKKIREGGSNAKLDTGSRFDNGRETKYLSQAYARLHRKSLAYTITCHFLNPGSGRFLHYRDHRAITVREAARFQSFEDSFVFEGTLREQEHQVGNAVPPIMARCIAEHIAEVIK